MTIHATHDGLALRIACEDGTIQNYRIDDETEHAILCDQLVGNLTEQEAGLLRSGLAQIEASRHAAKGGVRSTSGDRKVWFRVPRPGRLSAFVRYVAELVFGADEEEECGK